MKKAKRRHQALVEYIIIIAIVAIGSLTLLGLFSNTVKEKLSGIINSLTNSDNATEAEAEANESSVGQMKDLRAGGLDD